MTAQEIAQELRKQARLYDKVAEILDPIENYKPKNPFSMTEAYRRQIEQTAIAPKARRPPTKPTTTLGL